jgi:uncharacterized protein
MPHPSFQFVAHRPWPLPQTTWTSAQIWHDLLFAHWPLPPQDLRRLLPPELPLDTFDGSAWVGVVPFWMSGIRRRFLPPIAGLSRFPELNVRTYVTLQGRPGVYFFSLDAASSPAVWAARRFFHLPYFHARMRSRPIGGTIHYESARNKGPSAEFRGSFKPIGTIRLSGPGTLEHWLTERYCLYTTFAGRVYRGDIHHQQWPLQDAEAEIEVNTMAAASGIRLPISPPVLHFARKLEVAIWPLSRVQL